jgi:hypothetical protein
MDPNFSVHETDQGNNYFSRILAKMEQRNQLFAFYSSYECDTLVSNVLAYGPDGKVFIAEINFLGSWADGLLCA